MSLIVFAVIAGLSMQDPTVSEDCQDDNLVDRCAPERQAQTRTLLGMATIEDEAAADAEIYRASYVDGYGRDMPAVAFERRAGSSPVVTVYGFDGARLSAPVSAADWARVKEEAELADRQLAPPAGSNGEVLNLCLHSWVSTAEMANSSVSRHPVAVRRRTEDACSRGLTNRFAFRLAEIAVGAIAPCGELDRTRQRNDVTILATCLDLKGDRFTAVELRNERGRIGPDWGQDPSDEGLWRASMGLNGSPVLNWAGTEVASSRGRHDAVAKFIVARIADHPGLRFDQLQFEGIDRRRGVVTGEAWYEVGDHSYRAPYTQTWVWDPNLNEWMLERWIVEPFAVVQ